MKKHLLGSSIAFLLPAFLFGIGYAVFLTETIGACMDTQCALWKHGIFTTALFFMYISSLGSGVIGLPFACLICIAVYVLVIQIRGERA